MGSALHLVSTFAYTTLEIHVIQESEGGGGDRRSEQITVARRKRSLPSGEEAIGAQSANENRFGEDHVPF